MKNTTKKTVWSLTDEQIDRIIAIAMAIINALIAAACVPVRISISRGNEKIGRCLNFNTMPIITCGNCDDCKHLCYAAKLCHQYWKTVIPAWAKNTFMIRKHPESVYEQMDKAMSRRRNHKYLRWHVAGEFQKLNEIDLLFRLARKHPEFQCWTYTKMYPLINQYIHEHGGKSCIPANLHIMFSAWGVNAPRYILNPYGLPYYITVVDENGEKAPENVFKCPGRCDLCKAEYSADGCFHGCILGETTYTHTHN